MLNPVYRLNERSISKAVKICIEMGLEVTKAFCSLRLPPTGILGSLWLTVEPAIRPFFEIATTRGGKR